MNFVCFLINYIKYNDKIIQYDDKNFEVHFEVLGTV